MTDRRPAAGRRRVDVFIRACRAAGGTLLPVNCGPGRRRVRRADGEMRRCRQPAAVPVAVLAAVALMVTSCAGSGKDQATTAPTGPSTAATSPSGQHGAAGDESHEHDGAGHQHGASGGGLTPVQDGFRLATQQTPTAAGRQSELSFRISGPSGAPQTRFEEVHEKLMHVFVVRQDLSDFHHIHPTMAPDGTWSVPLTLRRPGPYRLVTDFVAVDDQNQPHPLVLGTDFELAGPYSPEPLPTPTREASVGGYAVHVDGDLVAGQTSMMAVRIIQGGAPVTDMKPYLGAMAHVAAFHEGDLEVVHMHPQEASSDGASPSDLMVHADFPVAGLYRMYIQFQTGDQLTTAPITVAVR